MQPDPVVRLRAVLLEHNLDAEILSPGKPMPTVPLAAAAIGVREELILKSLLFVAADEAAVLVVANGPHRIDRQRLASCTGLRKPRLADAETVVRLTGYPAGGVAPVGHASPLRVLVDERAAALEVAYGGGGAEHLLLRIRPLDIVRLTGAEIADVTKPDGA
jgi:Cys-tRNA(Pro) deacylase